MSEQSESDRHQHKNALAVSLIEANNLYRSYRNIAAVDGISFRIETGETYGLLGPNGAGKTTTMRMLSGLTPVDSGTLRVAGIDVVQDSRSVREIMGVVTQHDGLDAGLTVYQNLFLYGFLIGLSKSSAQKRTHEVLEFFNLRDRSKANVYELSGGMKRRLAIARSMMSSPTVIVLDEPSTGLDPQSRNRVWEELAILKESGVTVVLSTHYMEEAEYLADTVALMNHGKLITQGSLNDLRILYNKTSITFTSDDAYNQLPKNLKEIAVISEGTVSINTEDPTTILSELTGWAISRGIELSNLEVSRQNLEEIYLGILE